ncbi:hypothetical protein HaLaN_09464 [Haematococcus lacustris]|uniref:Uncharacterized protein n=1 Tax=Haematococcus lacustris TaxID=44745 RepID=A0A699Z2N9_HAELA|nr:hypothetical protein HaLaN_09464 [Haematococcus lacustris]
MPRQSLVITIPWAEPDALAPDVMRKVQAALQDNMHCPLLVNAATACGRTFITVWNPQSQQWVAQELTDVAAIPPEIILSQLPRLAAVAPTCLQLPVADLPSLSTHPWRAGWVRFMRWLAGQNLVLKYVLLGHIAVLLAMRTHHSSSTASVV